MSHMIKLLVTIITRRVKHKGKCCEICLGTILIYRLRHSLILLKFVHHIFFYLRETMLQTFILLLNALIRSMVIGLTSCSWHGRCDVMFKVLCCLSNVKVGHEVVIEKYSDPLGSDAVLCRCWLRSRTLPCGVHVDLVASFWLARNIEESRHLMSSWS